MDFEEASGKKKVVLKHCINGIEHLSFLRGSHMSPTQTIPLPFRGEHEIEGNCCRGLFYFNTFNFGSSGEHVRAAIVNLSTNQLKILPHPISHETYANGFGYDLQSDDYKVVRIRFGGETAEVYSLRNDTWKVIPGPGRGVMDADCGVYVGGYSYWRGWERIPGQGLDDYILSFDFMRETFCRLPLPPPLNPPLNELPVPPGIDLDVRVGIFDFDGSLGAFGYRKVYDYMPRVAKNVELWVYRDGSWGKLFTVILFDVGKPLGVKDGRFLFLEGDGRCEHSHLMVYDWIKKELREHSVYVEPPEEFLVLSYVENTLVLPDAMPLINSAQNVQHSKKASTSAPKRISHSLSPGMTLKRCSRRENLLNK